MSVIYRLIADCSGKVPDDEALVIADVPVNGQLGLTRNLKQKGCGCLLRVQSSLGLIARLLRVQALLRLITRLLRVQSLLRDIARWLRVQSLVRVIAQIHVN